LIILLPRTQQEMGRRDGYNSRAFWEYHMEVFSSNSILFIYESTKGSPVGGQASYEFYFINSNNYAKVIAIGKELSYTDTAFTRHAKLELEDTL